MRHTLFFFPHTANSSTSGPSLRQMCTVLTPKRFPGYSRSASTPPGVYLWRIKYGRQPRFNLILLQTNRFSTPMRARAKRSRSSRWRSERSPATSATKATSSSPLSTTSPPTARRAPNHCGTCSSRLPLWSAGAVTSNVTRTTWTKRRISSLHAKVRLPVALGLLCETPVLLLRQLFSHICFADAD